MKEIEGPRTTQTLVKALQRQHREIDAYFSSLEVEEFLAPQGEHWSPEGHLRHLVKCVRPMARALSLPKASLLLRFGPNLRRAGFGGASRSFEEVRDRYRALLAQGADAGPFSPSERSYEGTPKERREEVLGRWRKVSAALERAMARWGERALDRLRLPHPLLGKLTVREILLWTLYHNHHHVCRVRERIASASS